MSVPNPNPRTPQPAAAHPSLSGHPIPPKQFKDPPVKARPYTTPGLSQPDPDSQEEYSGWFSGLFPASVWVMLKCGDW